MSRTYASFTLMELEEMLEDGIDPPETAVQGLIDHIKDLSAENYALRTEAELDNTFRDWPPFERDPISYSSANIPGWVPPIIRWDGTHHFDPDEEHG